MSSYILTFKTASGTFFFLNVTSHQNSNSTILDVRNLSFDIINPAVNVKFKHILCSSMPKL